MKHLVEERIKSSGRFDVVSQLKLFFFCMLLVAFVGALSYSMHEFRDMTWGRIIHRLLFLTITFHYLLLCGYLFFEVFPSCKVKTKSEFRVSRFDVVTINEKNFECEYCQLSENKWAGILNDYPQYKVESDTLYGLDSSLKHLAEDIDAGRTPQTHYV